MAGAGSAGILARLGLAGIGTRLLGGIGLGIVAEIGANRGVLSTAILDAIKAFIGAVITDVRKALSLKSIVRELTPAPIERWLRSGDKGIAGGSKPDGQLNPADELPGLGEAVRENTKSLKSVGDRIEGTIGSDGLKGSAAEDRLAERIQRLADRSGYGRLALTALASRGTDYATGGMSGGSVGGGLSGATAPGGPGSPMIGNGDGTFNGLRLPGVRGSGGSASSNPANSAASAAMLDAIAGTESGKAGYDAVLGNGKYGTPSKPVSTMTLDEAFAFGRQVRARHGSSSALGRYQIVGNTMRAAQKALGIDGSATFDAAMQDRIARWIALSQGLGAWEGLKHNPAAMARARAAMVQGGAQDAPVAASGSSGPSGIADRIRALRDSGDISNAQCVALAKAYVGATGSVTGWRKGEGAEAGTLKPGTPIATFLNRDGSQSSRYAGGGTGTPGAGTDHAAVFQEYLKDQTGKITGMRVWEQYARSGGPKQKDYLFGQGFGERNGSNYHAILKLDGGYLGGRNNPMTADTLAESGRDEAVARGQAHRALVSGGGAGGAGGKSVTVHAPITVTGAPNPEATANRAAKHIQDSTNWTTFDRSFSALG